MLAIDTNLVVRYLTADHPAQARKARDIIDSNDIYLSTTVLLESQWVLCSVFAMPAASVARALDGFCGLPNVTLEDAPLVANALAWTRQGMDFADALHLGRAEFCEAFVSFDRGLAKAAKTLAKTPVRVP